jgi:hypothetical protein
VWRENYGVYGARKICLALNREGIGVARCATERPMHEPGLSGARPRKKVRTTWPDTAAQRLTFVGPPLGSVVPEGLDQLRLGHLRAALDANIPGPLYQVLLEPRTAVPARTAG